MIQIIWRMLSQTLRFGVFIVVIMAGFALAFNAVFGSCDAGSLLDESYGSFGTAFLTVFKAPLGEFEFEAFDDVGGVCPDIPSPGRASDAGTFLLVAYLVVLAVVMLNLLIAVLSTAHGEVYDNGEKEFHLARTRLILQSARAVAHRRIPPPFNLVQLVVGFLLDGASELAWLARLDAGRCGWREKNEKFVPITSTYGWHTFDGMLQRLLFAFTMGLVAVALNALLWVLSLPWVVWRLVSWVSYEFGKKGDNDEVEPFLSVKLRVKRGKFRAFLWVLCATARSVLALVFAAALCGVYVAGSFVLWLRGVCHVFEWAHWRRSEEGRFVSGETEEGACPTAMPGQERGQNWRHAWKYVAKARNFRVRHEHDSEHFHVAPLLQATTGLDMEEFCLRAKEKFKDQKQEQRADAPRAGKCGGCKDLDDLDPGADGGSVPRNQADEQPQHSGTSRTGLSPDFETKVTDFLKTVTTRMGENTVATENDGGEQKYASTTPRPPDLGQQQDREWAHEGIEVRSFGSGGVCTDRDGTAVFSSGGGGEKGSAVSPDNEPTESSNGSTSDSGLPEILKLSPVCESSGPRRGMNLLGSMDGSSRRTPV
ncbi:unnamed protein product [Ectocarpus fasciculatus]